jgi:heme-degrading monooxygenase HmoA
VYVRTLYATGDPAKLGAAVDATVTEGRALVSELPGFRGMGLFVDREIGKLLTATWWDDEKSRQDSDEQLRERRAVELGPFAQTAAVDNWEAAVAKPPQSVGPGAWFRLARLEFDPGDTDLLVNFFRDVALPRLEALTGFLGGSLLVDRAKGRASVGVVWSDRDVLAASRAGVAAIRGEAGAQARVITRSIEEFEVVFAGVAPPS